ncbi:hypothetical protein HPB50_007521 [Hyalomma asiaticum]|uniref:Uncharacterized protein n=1 Tax=Hyalomma asiaticum TaxID=266040 RepID=A0ACB7TDH3_HYAAI|nr:hypothetical protein HPB50_007521 [Hyalomma asiaticum]
MENWDFDCPKYVNLASGSDESVEQLEKYFEEDHEQVGHRPKTRAATAAQAVLKGQEDIKCYQNSQHIAPPSSAGACSRRQASFKESDEAKEAEGQTTDVMISLSKKACVKCESLPFQQHSAKVWLSLWANSTARHQQGFGEFQRTQMKGDEGKDAAHSTVNKPVVSSAVEKSTPPSSAKNNH